MAEQIQHFALPKEHKAFYEFVPLRSWAWTSLFTALLDDEGPFVLQHEPRGRSEAPDWALTSKQRKVSIEATRFVTPAMGVVIREAKTPVDTTHLTLKKWPSPTFVKDLRAGKYEHDDPHGSWSPCAEHENDFFTIAAERIAEKYIGLSKYRDEYTHTILLIWDCLFSFDTTIVDRPTVISHWFTKMSKDGFDAVIMADGGIGVAAKVSKLWQKTR